MASRVNKVGMSVAEMTTEKKAKFIEELARTGNITEACRLVGTTRTTVFRHRKIDKSFAADWENAKKRATEALELEARRRGAEGWDEPVFHQGQVCGSVRKYSDTLLIFLLKGLKPKMYRDRIEHSGDPKRPVVVRSEDISDEELAAIIAKGRAKKAAEGK